MKKHTSKNKAKYIKDFHGGKSYIKNFGKKVKKKKVNKKDSN